MRMPTLEELIVMHLIFINTDVELISGDFAKVKVTGALDYDLIGELM